MHVYIYMYTFILIYNIYILYKYFTFKYDLFFLNVMHVSTYKYIINMHNTHIYYVNKNAFIIYKHVSRLFSIISLRALMCIYIYIYIYIYISNKLIYFFSSLFNSLYKSLLLLFNVSLL